MVFKQEQLDDTSLAGCWRLANQNKGAYFVRDELLCHNEHIMGQRVDQLCVPASRRNYTLKMAHEMLGGHMAEKKTRQRIKLSGLYWPTVKADCRQYCAACHSCQKRARVTCYDRVPITAVPRADETFSHWFLDAWGPMFPAAQKVTYNYGLLLIDSATRWPVGFPMKNMKAKTVFECLMQLFIQTGLPSSVTIASDCGSNFTAALTQEFMSRMGCSPRFNTPGHPQATGAVERAIGTVKNMLHKVAFENPTKWPSYLPYVLFALREVPSESTGCPPFLLVYGQLMRGPLAILKETWSGQRDLPFSLGKSAEQFLAELREKLQIAGLYASEYSKKARNRYVSRYNLRSRDKHFNVNDKCLILEPDSTASKLFARWRGPGTVVEVKSPHSYIVELNGARCHVHANKMRRYFMQVDNVSCHLLSVQPCLEDDSAVVCNNCAVIYERDADFGTIQVVEPVVHGAQSELLPSKKIDHARLSHLK